MAGAREAFAFLEGEGFRRKKITDLVSFSKFAYVSPEVVFEISMDWREKRVSVYVSRPVDGKPPPGGTVYEGRRVRDYLAGALLRGDEKDRAAAARLLEVINRTGFVGMLDHLSVSASVARETLPSILARLDEIFV